VLFFGCGRSAARLALLGQQRTAIRIDAAVRAGDDTACVADPVCASTAWASATHEAVLRAIAVLAQIGSRLR
jgi:acetyl/propionyl-CoA carboxylase alpha subunit